MQLLNINKSVLTNVKNHFGCVTRAGNVRNLAPQNLTDFVYFDG